MQPDVPDRAFMLPGYVTIPDAISLICARELSTARAPLSLDELGRGATRRSGTREGWGAQWNACWHRLREQLTEGVIQGYDLGLHGDISPIDPSSWLDPRIMDNPPDARRQRWMPVGLLRLVVRECDLLPPHHADEMQILKPASAGGKRGPKEKYDRIAIICEAASIMLGPAKKGYTRPRSREELIKRLADWYQATYMTEAPDRNTMQPWISQFWTHFAFDED